MTRLIPLLTLLVARAMTYKIDPATFSNVRCSDGNKLATPTYGDKGIVFTVCAEKEISAPIQAVYDALLDFSRYSEWNSFVVKVTGEGNSAVPPGPVPVGTKVTFTTAGVVPGFNTTSGEVVTIDERDVDGSGRVAINGWRFDGFGQLAEHPNILTDLGNGKTRYVSYESFYGLVAPLTAFLKSALQRQFEQQGEDLKNFVEGR